jgi:7-cyano-7-deazaguanine synthase
MQALNQDKAIVLFSGGQDSSIVLAWALSHFSSVETIGFDYGQRHSVELGARATIRREFLRNFKPWASKFGGDTLVDLGALARLSESALTTDMEIKMAANGLPTTFVPGRNLAFLVLAGALAYRRGAGVLVAGMCQADYSGYPDCRDDALQAQIEALRLGMDADLRLETPLMHLTKADSWALAEKIGGERLVEIINEHSHSCYRGVRSVRRDWGYGCDDCPACALRRKGWEAYRAMSSGGSPA